MYNIVIKSFDEWRQQARQFLGREITPDEITWQDAKSAQMGLFGFDDKHANAPLPRNFYVVPREFMMLAQRVACHRDPERWALLYQALWRLTHEEKGLLNVSVDPVVDRLRLMEKAIRFDTHKTKAFVRFRLIQDEGGDHYIAWHRPDHPILTLAAPFFQRRFDVMRWTIMTPDETAHWDGKTLHYSAGVPREAAPSEDELEDLWLTYYRSTFNPARIKLNMMRKEMPVRHWATLPETVQIPAMLKEAPARITEMMKYAEGHATSAADFIPQDGTWGQVRDAAKNCTACPLHCDATQTVFGIGPLDAKLMIVGEQPGDQEDLQGLPFVGPAGEVLNQAFDELYIERDQLYLTNAVKHFKFRRKGPRRWHSNPDVHEMNACKPWVLKEIELVKPKAVLCLGLTAARSLIGHGVSMKAQRGQWQDGHGTKLMASYHPAAILRMPDETEKAALYNHLVSDIKAAFVYASLQA